MWMLNEPFQNRRMVAVFTDLKCFGHVTVVTVRCGIKLLSEPTTARLQASQSVVICRTVWKPSKLICVWGCFFTIFDNGWNLDMTPITAQLWASVVNDTIVTDPNIRQPRHHTQSLLNRLETKSAPVSYGFAKLNYVSVKVAESRQ